MSLIHRNALRRVAVISRVCCRKYSEEPDRNKPVKFSTSEAANWRAEFSRKGTSLDDSPEAQPYIISLSLAVFLGYFLLFREESDLDKNLNIFEDNLYDKVDGLEEVDLKARRQRLLASGQSVREVDERLRQIEEEKLVKEKSS